jgi:uncharacterized protein YndB with AHSA1/START domain
MSTDAKTTPADGVLERAADGRQMLRYERRLAHPIERVWAALTEPAQLAAWLADADIELVEGGRVELRWQNTDQDGNQAVARGSITRLEPPRLLEIATDIHGLLRWQLRPEGAGCALSFSATVELPAGMVPIVRAGWHIHLDHLADALDGHPINWPTWRRDHWGRWEELRAEYARTTS